MLASSVSNMVKVDYSDLTKTKDTPLKETCLFLLCVPVWIPTFMYMCLIPLDTRKLEWGSDSLN